MNDSRVDVTPNEFSAMDTVPRRLTAASFSLSNVLPSSSGPSLVNDAPAGASSIPGSSAQHRANATHVSPTPTPRDLSVKKHASQDPNRVRIPLQEMLNSENVEFLTSHDCSDECFVYNSEDEEELDAISEAMSYFL